MVDDCGRKGGVWRQLWRTYVKKMHAVSARAATQNQLSVSSARLVRVIVVHDSDHSSEKPSGIVFSVV